MPELLKRRTFWGTVFVALIALIMLPVALSPPRKPSLQDQFMQVRPGMTRQEVFAILKPSGAVLTGDIVTWSDKDCRLRVFFKDGRVVMAPIERVPRSTLQKIRDFLGL
jgi:hypothetical protein